AQCLAHPLLYVLEGERLHPVGPDGDALEQGAGLVVAGLADRQHRVQVDMRLDEGWCHQGAAEVEDLPRIGLRGDPAAVAHGQLRGSVESGDARVANQQVEHGRRLSELSPNPPIRAKLRTSSFNEGEPEMATIEEQIRSGAVPVREGEYGERVVAVEPGGIEYIPDSERHGRPLDLFWTWVSPNMEFATVFVGVLPIAFFGMGFVDASIAIILGTALGCITHGIVSSWGPKFGVPQM